MTRVTSAADASYESNFNSEIILSGCRKQHKHVIMKIGFAGRWSPSDKNAWSGTYFNSYQAIRKHHDVQCYHYQWPWLLRERLIFQKQIQKLYHRKLAVEFLRDYARWFSKQLERELRQTRPDLLFVPGAPQLVAYCKTSVPLIYMADATFQQLQGYYDSFSNLAPYNIRQGIVLDQCAFNNAAHCMLASDWAKQSAIQDYHIPENRITVQPLGANLDTIPPVSSLKKEKGKVCQLLFIGVEWERKGGQIALDTFYALKNEGMDVQLTIIGCRPPLSLTDKGIRVIPFINKENETEAAIFNDILRQADFLILPTRAECAGLVFCEASAFGLPSITTVTGGISTYVQDGINGFTLPLTAGAAVYAVMIRELYADTDSYLQLRASSRNRFETTLNWDVWANSFNRIAENILNR